MHKRVLRLEVCFVRRRRIPQRSGVLVVVNPAPSSALSGEGELKRGEMRSHYSHSLFPPLLFSPGFIRSPNSDRNSSSFQDRLKPLFFRSSPQKRREKTRTLCCVRRESFLGPLLHIGACPLPPRFLRGPIPLSSLTAAGAALSAAKNE